MTPDLLGQSVGPILKYLDTREKRALLADIEAANAAMLDAQLQ